MIRLRFYIFLALCMNIALNLRAMHPTAITTESTDCAIAVVDPRSDNERAYRKKSLSQIRINDIMTYTTDCNIPTTEPSIPLIDHANNTTYGATKNILFRHNRLYWLTPQTNNQFIRQFSLYENEHSLHCWFRQSRESIWHYVFLPYGCNDFILPLNTDILLLPEMHRGNTQPQYSVTFKLIVDNDGIANFIDNNLSILSSRSNNNSPLTTYSNDTTVYASPLGKRKNTTNHYRTKLPDYDNAFDYDLTTYNKNILNEYCQANELEAVHQMNTMLLNATIHAKNHDKSWLALAEKLFQNTYQILIPKSEKSA